MKRKLLPKYLTGMLTFIGVDLSLKHFFIMQKMAIFNGGFFLGSFREANPFLRITALSSLSGFLFFIYLMLLIFTSQKLKEVKWATTLLMSGIMANVLDRMLHAYTTDFIPSTLLGQTYYFNTADIFIVLGSVALIACFFYFEEKIWSPNNLRGQFLVNPAEQVRFSLKLVTISFATSVLLGLFCLGLWRSHLSEGNQEAFYQQLLLFSLAYFFIVLIFMVVVFIAGLFISHRTAGPLYAFELYVEQLLAGRRHHLKLREGDNYRHFEEVANKLHHYFSGHDNNR